MVIPLIVDPTDKIYSDLPGQFPTKYPKGNQYIFVLYHYDSNEILTEPMKTEQTLKFSEHIPNKSITSLTEECDPNSKYWTMNHPKDSKETFPKDIAISNW